MAPYDPPVAHYAHVKVGEYPDAVIFSFMGKGGSVFYKLTSLLGLRYMWYNESLKVIELWGSYEAMKRDPVSRIQKKLDIFYKNVYNPC
jgi:hypothetical protein